MSNYIALRVAQVVEETADARSLVFEVPPSLAEAFRYRPGQFLTLRVPHGDDWLPRCYSLSSTPLLEEPLRVTIKRVADGRASNWLCDQLRAGDSLQVLPPAGVFVPSVWRVTCCCLAAAAASRRFCRFCARRCSQAQAGSC